jgi:hypothetical protein
VEVLFSGWDIVIFTIEKGKGKLSIYIRGYFRIKPANWQSANKLNT